MAPNFYFVPNKKNPTSISTCEALIYLVSKFRQKSGGTRYLCEGESFYSPELATTKKKYSREHMMLLILTYHLKQILSIGDIHSLLSPISPTSIETLYNNFIEIQSKEYNTLD